MISNRSNLSSNKTFAFPLSDVGENCETYAEGERNFGLGDGNDKVSVEFSESAYRCVEQQQCQISQLILPWCLKQLVFIVLHNIPLPPLGNPTPRVLVGPCFQCGYGNR